MKEGDGSREAVLTLFDDIDQDHNNEISRDELYEHLLAKQRSNAAGAGSICIPGVVGVISEKGADMLNSVYRVCQTAVEAVPYVPRAAEVAWRLFNVCDLNHDGAVTKSELIRAMRRDPELSSQLGLSSSHVKAADEKAAFLGMFSEIDTNENGELTQDELRRWLARKRGEGEPGRDEPGRDEPGGDQPDGSGSGSESGGGASGMLLARPTYDVQTSALQNETQTPAPTSIASGAVDVAPLGEAAQSSTYMGMGAARAIRGYRSSKQGFDSAGEYAHTKVQL